MKPITLHDVACHHCGEKGRMKGQVTCADTLITRFYCREKENNCYNSQLGHYFDDLR